MEKLDLHFLDYREQSGIKCRPSGHGLILTPSTPVCHFFLPVSCRWNFSTCPQVPTDWFAALTCHLTLCCAHTAAPHC